MRVLIAYGILVGLALLAAQPGRSADADREFFNGKDTAGWEGLGQYWSVTDGALVGSTIPDGLQFNTFLCSKRKYRDFELRFQVRLKGGKGNSGVQIRSKMHEPERDKFAVAGPQCDIGEGWWGSLYGEHVGGMMQAADADAVKRVLRPDDFNDYFIRCAGNHVTIKINGTATVDGDFPKMPAEGIIAWQLHSGGPMEVTFRKIEFRELKGE